MESEGTPQNGLTKEEMQALLDRFVQTDVVDMEHSNKSGLERTYRYTRENMPGNLRNDPDGYPENNFD
jgi:hypothetical protein